LLEGNSTNTDEILRNSSRALGIYGVSRVFNNTRVDTTTEIFNDEIDCVEVSTISVKQSEGIELISSDSQVSNDNTSRVGGNTGIGIQVDQGVCTVIIEDDLWVSSGDSGNCEVSSSRSREIGREIEEGSRNLTTTSDLNQITRSDKDVLIVSSTVSTTEGW